MSLATMIDDYQAAVEAGVALTPQAFDDLLTGILSALREEHGPLAAGPEGLEYPSPVVAPRSGPNDASLPSTRPFDPALNADFLAAHGRNVDRLRALL